LSTQSQQDKQESYRRDRREDGREDARGTITKRQILDILTIYISSFQM